MTVSALRMSRVEAWPLASRLCQTRPAARGSPSPLPLLPLNGSLTASATTFGDPRVPRCPPRRGAQVPRDKQASRGAWLGRGCGELSIWAAATPTTWEVPLSLHQPARPSRLRQKSEGAAWRGDRLRPTQRLGFHQKQVRVATEHTYEELGEPSSQPVTTVLSPDLAQFRGVTGFGLHVAATH